MGLLAVVKWSVVVLMFLNGVFTKCYFLCSTVKRDMKFDKVMQELGQFVTTRAYQERLLRASKLNEESLTCWSWSYFSRYLWNIGLINIKDRNCSEKKGKKERKERKKERKGRIGRKKERKEERKKERKKERKERKGMEKKDIVIALTR